jgi:hypothetical protein
MAAEAQVPQKWAFDTCKSGRSRRAVIEERGREYAKLIAIWNAVVAEREKRAKRDARIEKAKVRWLQDHPGEPFDPEEFVEDLTPIPIDMKLHEDFQVQHFVLEALDDELKGKVDG